MSGRLVSRVRAPRFGSKGRALVRRLSSELSEQIALRLVQFLHFVAILSPRSKTSRYIFTFAEDRTVTRNAIYRVTAGNPEENQLAAT